MIKGKKFFVYLSLSLFFVALQLSLQSCTIHSYGKQIKEMTVAKLKGKIAQGGVIIIDVRKRRDFLKSHIKNAIYIDEKNFDYFAKNTKKSKLIVVYCYRGNSSKRTVLLFTQKGFPKVYNLIGGFNAWRRSN